MLRPTVRTREIAHMLDWLTNWGDARTDSSDVAATIPTFASESSREEPCGVDHDGVRLSAVKDLQQDVGDLSALRTRSSGRLRREGQGKRSLVRAEAGGLGVRSAEEKVGDSSAAEVREGEREELVFGQHVLSDAVDLDHSRDDVTDVLAGLHGVVEGLIQVERVQPDQ
eukprot:410875-Rhodomonas_salina.2